MRINLKALKDMGFEAHYEADTDTVDIYPHEHRDITEDLRKLTDLPTRDCYELMDNIHEMQVFNAIKETR
jgi:hypothetical protein